MYSNNPQIHDIVMIEPPSKHADKVGTVIQKIRDRFDMSGINEEQRKLRIATGRTGYAVLVEIDNGVQSDQIWIKANLVSVICSGGFLKLS